MQAACHSREDECLVGDDCLCKVARTTNLPHALVVAPVPSTAPERPVQASFKQPSAPALKAQKPKDTKKAEEADKKAKEVCAQAKNPLSCSREDEWCRQDCDTHLTWVRRWRLSCSALPEWRSSWSC